MAIDRRTFLTRAAAFGALSAGARWSGLLGPAGQAEAQASQVSSQQRNLVIVFNAGGWDTTVSIDPKPGLDSVDVVDGSVQMYGDCPIWVDPSRPNLQAFFDRRADITAVINGVDTASVAHAACRKRALTGLRSAGNPDLGAIVGTALGNDRPIPYLVFGDAAFPGPLGVSMGRAGTSNQIRSLLHPDAAFPLPTDATYTRQMPNAAQDALLQRYVAARAQRDQAVRGQRGYNRARLADFQLSLERSEVLLRKREVFGATQGRLAYEAQARLAVDALQNGVSRAVLIDGRLRWDTHAMNDDQIQHQDELFGVLTVLADELEAAPGAATGASLLDETVVLVLSEMNRTPKLNDTAGKDHWPIGGVLVFGAGVDGGRLCGGTTDDLLGVKTDLSTGQPDDAGELMFSEHVIAGVLELVGVDPTPHLPGVNPLRGFVA